MKDRVAILAIFITSAIGSALYLYGAAETGKVTREDVFNNQDQNGLWSRLSLAIEQGDFGYVKEVVPTRITRDLTRNFPGARSNNLTAYDIALFNLSNSAAQGLDVEIPQHEIAGYLNPAQEITPGGSVLEAEVKELAAKPVIPSIKEQSTNFMNFIKLMAEKEDVPLIKKLAPLAPYSANEQAYTDIEITTIILPVLKTGIMTQNWPVVTEILNSKLIQGKNLEESQKLFLALYADEWYKGGPLYQIGNMLRLMSGLKQ